MDSFQKLDPFYRYNLIVSILNKYPNDLVFLKFVQSLITKQLSDISLNHK